MRAARTSAPAGRDHRGVMAWAGGAVAEHRPMAPGVASLPAERLASCRDMWWGCAAPEVCGGPPGARAGCTRSAQAAQEARGTVADGRRPPEPCDEPGQSGRARPVPAAQAGEAAMRKRGAG